MKISQTICYIHSSQQRCRLILKVLRPSELSDIIVKFCISFWIRSSEPILYAWSRMQYHNKYLYEL